jgi:hypothetical protein
MSDNAAVQLGHKRNSQGVGGAERSNDVLFRVIADRQRTECSDCDAGNGAGIGGGLVPDHYRGLRAIPHKVLESCVGLLVSL